ncbi:hypothetical protein AAFF_G00048520 [Aldrovandia affinis]|uniref:Uncharacterized protein n=1 Tax=Aldrovandia affinis TaxID=143900 RepID=A0AAD7S1K0_9TELE|nr:hypothetical protein AAFF_G00048520 [Aldrovandia affinis]
MMRVLFENSEVQTSALALLDGRALATDASSGLKMGGKITSDKTEIANSLNGFFSPDHTVGLMMRVLFENSEVQTSALALLDGRALATDASSGASEQQDKQFECVVVTGSCRRLSDKNKHNNSSVRRSLWLH